MKDSILINILAELLLCNIKIIVSYTPYDYYLLFSQLFIFFSGWYFIYRSYFMITLRGKYACTEEDIKNDFYSFTKEEVDSFSKGYKYPDWADFYVAGDFDPVNEELDFIVGFPDVDEDYIDDYYTDEDYIDEDYIDEDYIDEDDMDEDDENHTDVDDINNIEEKKYRNKEEEINEKEEEINEKEEEVNKKEEEEKEKDEEALYRAKSYLERYEWFLKQRKKNNEMLEKKLKQKYENLYEVIMSKMRNHNIYYSYLTPDVTLEEHIHYPFYLSEQKRWKILEQMKINTHRNRGMSYLEKMFYTSNYEDQYEAQPIPKNDEERRQQKKEYTEKLKGRTKHIRKWDKRSIFYRYPLIKGYMHSHLIKKFTNRIIGVVKNAIGYYGGPVYFFLQKFHNFRLELNPVNFITSLYKGIIDWTSWSYRWSRNLSMGSPRYLNKLRKSYFMRRYVLKLPYMHQIFDIMIRNRLTLYGQYKTNQATKRLIKKVAKKIHEGLKTREEKKRFFTKVNRYSSHLYLNYLFSRKNLKKLLKAIRSDYGKRPITLAFFRFMNRDLIRLLKDSNAFLADGLAKRKFIKTYQFEKFNTKFRLFKRRGRSLKSDTKFKKEFRLVQHVMFLAIYYIFRDQFYRRNRLDKYLNRLLKNITPAEVLRFNYQLGGFFNRIRIDVWLAANLLFRGKKFRESFEPDFSILKKYKKDIIKFILNEVNGYQRVGLFNFYYLSKDHFSKIKNGFYVQKTKKIKLKKKILHSDLIKIMGVYKFIESYKDKLTRSTYLSSLFKARLYKLLKKIAEEEEEKKKDSNLKSESKSESKSKSKFEWKNAFSFLLNSKSNRFKHIKTLFSFIYKASKSNPFNKNSMRLQKSSFFWPDTIEQRLIEDVLSIKDPAKREVEYSRVKSRIKKRIKKKYKAFSRYLKLKVMDTLPENVTNLEEWNKLVRSWKRRRLSLNESKTIAAYFKPQYHFISQSLGFKFRNRHKKYGLKTHTYTDSITKRMKAARIKSHYFKFFHLMKKSLARFNKSTTRMNTTRHSLLTNKYSFLQEVINKRLNKKSSKYYKSIALVINLRRLIIRQYSYTEFILFINNLKTINPNELNHGKSIKSNFFFNFLGKVLLENLLNNLKHYIYKMFSFSFYFILDFISNMALYFKFLLVTVPLKFIYTLIFFYFIPIYGCIVYFIYSLIRFIIKVHIEEFIPQSLKLTTLYIYRRTYVLSRPSFFRRFYNYFERRVFKIIEYLILFIVKKLNYIFFMFLSVLYLIFRLIGFIIFQLDISYFTDGLDLRNHFTIDAHYDRNNRPVRFFFISLMNLFRYDRLSIARMYVDLTLAALLSSIVNHSRQHWKKITIQIIKAIMFIIYKLSIYFPILVVIVSRFLFKISLSTFIPASLLLHSLFLVYVNTYHIFINLQPLEIFISEYIYIYNLFFNLFIFFITIMLLNILVFKFLKLILIPLRESFKKLILFYIDIYLLYFSMCHLNFFILILFFNKFILNKIQSILVLFSNYILLYLNIYLLYIDIYLLSIYNFFCYIFSNFFKIFFFFFLIIYQLMLKIYKFAPNIMNIVFKILYIKFYIFFLFLLHLLNLSYYICTFMVTLINYITSQIINQVYLIAIITYYTYIYLFIIIFNSLYKLNIIIYNYIVNLIYLTAIITYYTYISLFLNLFYIFYKINLIIINQIYCIFIINYYTLIYIYQGIIIYFIKSSKCIQLVIFISFKTVIHIIYNINNYFNNIRNFYFQFNFKMIINTMNAINNISYYFSNIHNFYFQFILFLMQINYFIFFFFKLNFFKLKKKLKYILFNFLFFIFYYFDLFYIFGSLHITLIRIFFLIDKTFYSRNSFLHINRIRYYYKHLKKHFFNIIKFILNMLINIISSFLFSVFYYLDFFYIFGSLHITLIRIFFLIDETFYSRNSFLYINKIKYYYRTIIYRCRVFYYRLFKIHLKDLVIKYIITKFLIINQFIINPKKYIYKYAFNFFSYIFMHYQWFFIYLIHLQYVLLQLKTYIMNFFFIQYLIKRARYLKDKFRLGHREEGLILSFFYMIISRLKPRGLRFYLNTSVFKIRIFSFLFVNLLDRTRLRQLYRASYYFIACFKFINRLLYHFFFGIMIKRIIEVLRKKIYRIYNYDELFFSLPMYITISPIFLIDFFIHNVIGDLWVYQNIFPIIVTFIWYLMACIYYYTLKFISSVPILARLISFLMQYFYFYFFFFSRYIFFSISCIHYIAPFLPYLTEIEFQDLIPWEFIRGLDWTVGRVEEISTNFTIIFALIVGITSLYYLHIRSNDLLLNITRLFLIRSRWVQEYKKYYLYSDLKLPISKLRDGYESIMLRFWHFRWYKLHTAFYNRPHLYWKFHSRYASSMTNYRHYFAGTIRDALFYNGKKKTFFFRLHSNVLLKYKKKNFNFIKLKTKWSLIFPYVINSFKWKKTWEFFKINISRDRISHLIYLQRNGFSFKRIPFWAGKRDKDLFVPLDLKVSSRILRVRNLFLKNYLERYYKKDIVDDSRYVKSIETDHSFYNLLKNLNKRIQQYIGHQTYYRSGLYYYLDSKKLINKIIKKITHCFFYIFWIILHIYRLSCLIILFVIIFCFNILKFIIPEILINVLINNELLSIDRKLSSKITNLYNRIIIDSLPEIKYNLINDYIIIINFFANIITKYYIIIYNIIFFIGLLLSQFIIFSIRIILTIILSYKEISEYIKLSLYMFFYISGHGSDFSSIDIIKLDRFKELNKKIYLTLTKRYIVDVPRNKNPYIIFRRKNFTEFERINDKYNIRKKPVAFECPDPELALKMTQILESFDKLVKNKEFKKAKYLKKMAADFVKKIEIINKSEYYHFYKRHDYINPKDMKDQ